MILRLTTFILFTFISAAATAEVLERGIDAWHQSDYASAEQLWLKSAETGNPKAQLYLGYLYMKQLNQPDKAAFWYEKAAKNDVKEAQLELSLFYELGYGVPVDHDKAGTWYHKALDTGLCPHELPAGGILGAD